MRTATPRFQEAKIASKLYVQPTPGHLGLVPGHDLSASRHTSLLVGGNNVMWSMRRPTNLNQKKKIEKGIAAYR